MAKNYKYENIIDFVNHILRSNDFTKEEFENASKLGLLNDEKLIEDYYDAIDILDEIEYSTETQKKYNIELVDFDNYTDVDVDHGWHEDTYVYKWYDKYYEVIISWIAHDGLDIDSLDHNGVYEVKPKEITKTIYIRK